MVFKIHLWQVALLLLLLALCGNSSLACSRWFTAIDGGKQLARLNRYNGKVQVIGTFSDGNVVRAMGYDYKTGTIYCIVRGFQLATLKPMPSARVEVIGAGAGPGVSQLRAMAISQGGTIYAYSGNNTGLYRLNKTTGKAKFLFRTNITGITNMIYQYEHNRIYATNGDRGLFQVIPARKRVTRLGTIAGPKLSSLVITSTGELFGLTGGSKDPSTGGDEIRARVERIVRRGDGSIDNVFKANATLPSRAVGGTLQCSDTLPPSVFPPSRAPTPPTAVPSLVPSFGETSLAPSLGVTSLAPSLVPSLGVTSLYPSLGETSLAPSLVPSSLAPSLGETSLAPSFVPSLGETSLAPSLVPSLGESSFAPGSLFPGSLTPSLGETSLAPSLVPSLGETSRAPFPGETSVPSSLPPSSSPSSGAPSLGETSLAPSLVPSSLAPSLGETSLAPSLFPSLGETSLAPSLSATSMAPSIPAPSTVPVMLPSMTPRPAPT